MISSADQCIRQSVVMALSADGLYHVGSTLCVSTYYVYMYNVHIDCIEHKGCMSKYNTFEKNEFLTSSAREKYKIVKESYFLYVIVTSFNWKSCKQSSDVIVREFVK